jgi:hypothetical protein
MSKTEILVPLFIALGLVSACKSVPDASTLAARDAVSALRKIEAATHVGMTLYAMLFRLCFWLR